MVYILMVMGVLTAVGVAIPCHLYTNWYHIPIFLGMCVGFFILWAAIYLLAALILAAFCNIKKVEYDPIPFYQWLARETMKYILFFTNTSVKVEGIEKVPTDRKCLVVANHLSNYDPISIMTHMPLKPLIFISKPENFNLPVAGGIVRKAGFMAIDRDHVKNAIITVLNTLPGRRDEILRLHAAIHDGEIKQIDTMIVSIEKRKKKLEEIYDEEKTEILSHEIESLEMERTGLILERAELANKGIKLRILLELIDIMDGENEADTDLPACFNYEDFFRRTKYRPKEGIVEDGKIRKFDDGLVVRYLDKVIVKEDRYEINLKGGITGDVNFWS